MTVTELREVLAGQAGETLVMFDDEHITKLEVVPGIPEENMAAYINFTGMMR